ncbi:hypothetical protein OGATHE_001473 [Ogataea polymorpha]|uniref:V-type proton ATPase subunit G n=1 Tax=Ogataea polymorpha TaxID=460523 RepID=A0A9P8TEU5_9ASCO|nr:hypothetical protein OGATHE_001473 [Ogataea polymorpha]
MPKRFFDESNDANKSGEDTQSKCLTSIVQNSNEELYGSLSFCRSQTNELDRAQKLKDAKSDAQKEIEQYRLKKEAELKKYEEEFQGSNQKLEKEAEEQIKDELANIKKTCESKKENVIKLLIDAVISPKPELHINARQ